ncbi:MAG TPA: NUDIX domain-containing protein [bacterium]|nr:NUDIX domain-containing protein [bacterium]
MKKGVEKYRSGTLAFIIDSNNKFLVIQKVIYSSSDWTVIGGGRKKNEDAVDNLFREIKEELGLGKRNFEIIGKSKSYLQYDYPKEMRKKIHKGKYIGQKYDQFLLRLIGSKNDIRTNEEIRKVDWVLFGELQNRLNFEGQYENAKSVIEELLSSKSLNE